MPHPTPFHERTAALCTSLRFKEWAGSYAVCAYDTYVDREYYAFRHTAGLLDVTPLYKYEVRGAGAADFLAHVMVRDVRRLERGRVWYTCWCDDDGKVLDDGTVTHLRRDHYRVTSATPNLAWLRTQARGFDVTVEDVTRALCALAIQGPLARAMLQSVCATDLSGLKFFRAAGATIEGVGEALVTRTGYTGDLGFEIWVRNEQALPLWDALLAAGRPHGLIPAGLDALDVVRVEAGFVLLGVDYFSARDARIPAQTSTPSEIGLGWMVDLDRERFVGQHALAAEAARGPAWALVGLEIDWEEFETLHDRVGLPPHLAVATCREGVPIHLGGRQVGQATSRTWSPTLKRYLALASVHAAHGQVGTTLQIEVTVEYVRHRASARVVPMPFFPPTRMRKG